MTNFQKLILFSCNAWILGTNIITFWSANIQGKFKEGSRKVQKRFKDGLEKNQRMLRDDLKKVWGRFREGYKEVQ